MGFERLCIVRLLEYGADNNPHKLQEDAQGSRVLDGGSETLGVLKEGRLDFVEAEASL